MIWKPDIGIKWLRTVNNQLAFAYYKKGRSLLKNTGNNPGSKPHLKQAETVFRKAAGIGIRKDYPFHWLFYIYRKQNAYRRALAVFSTYYKKHPDRYALSMILGDCHSRLGNFEKSITLL